MMKIFKIKHSTIGLWSLGGCSVNDRISKTLKNGKAKYRYWGAGKSWDGIGPLKLHLSQYCTRQSVYKHNITGDLVDWKTAHYGGNFADYTYFGRNHWINNIPDTWIVEEYDSDNPNGVISYPAKSLYPETSYII